MSRLTGKENWDYRYTPATIEAAPGLKRHGRLPERFFGSYFWQRFWSTIEKNLPKKSGQMVLEIGCAPGTILHGFASRFGCIPHGVDFSEPGVDRTRENFQRWGYAPENVIHADIFDPEYQKSVAGMFDIVVSGGFVEHFTDLRAVIDAHIAPLRPGGLLVVAIPNFRGLNYVISGLTPARDLLPLHNLEIMNLKRFREVFSSQHLQILSCGYFGGFDWGISDTGGQTPLLKTFRLLQAGLNLLFRIVPPPEFRWTSPYLLCVGRKVPTGDPDLAH
jgi:2-polyprenyl-3-methyl-5-hydroxy-6-metoxy-1,4-benzoquinol methylase